MNQHSVNFYPTHPYRPLASNTWIIVLGTFISPLVERNAESVKRRVSSKVDKGRKIGCDPDAHREALGVVAQTKEQRRSLCCQAWETVLVLREPHHF